MEAVETNSGRLCSTSRGKCKQDKVRIENVGM